MSLNTINELEKKLERIICKISELECHNSDDQYEDDINDLEFEKEELEDTIESLKEENEEAEK